MNRLEAQSSKLPLKFENEDPTIKTAYESQDRCLATRYAGLLMMSADSHEGRSFQVRKGGVTPDSNAALRKEM